MNGLEFSPKPPYFSLSAEESNGDEELIFFMNQFHHYEFCDDNAEKIEELIQFQKRFYEVYGQALEADTLRQDLKEANQKITEALEKYEQAFGGKEAFLENFEKTKNEIETVAKEKFDKIEEQQKKFRERRDEEFNKLLASMEFKDDAAHCAGAVGAGVVAGGLTTGLGIAFAVVLAVPTGGLSLAFFAASIPLTLGATVVTTEAVSRDLNYSRYRYYKEAKTEYEGYIAEHPLATANQAKEHLLK